MSDFLKNLKSIFVVQPEDGKAEITTKTYPDQPSESPDHPKVTVAIDREQLKDGSVNQKFMDILLKAIESNNQEGFDYLEYKRALQNLAEMPMDEGTKYKSAFAAAQTMGVTSQSLLDSAQYYIGVLAGEQDKFARALANQKSQQIEGGKQRMVELERAIIAKEDQITALQKEIESSRTELDAMRGEVEAAATKVEQTRLNFEKTFSVLDGQIKEDVKNIQQFLGS